MEESVNSQYLHWHFPHGIVPNKGVDNSWGRLLWTGVSRIFLAVSKSSSSLLETSNFSLHRSGS